MEIHPIKTWFDKRHGVVEVPDDVLGVVRQVKQMADGRLTIYWNDQSSKFDVVERCLDGTDRLVFSVDELDARVLTRLQNADHWGADTPDRGMKRADEDDFLADLERYEAEVKEQEWDGVRGRTEEIGERLAWALDNVTDRPSVGGSILVKKDIRGSSETK